MMTVAMQAVGTIPPSGGVTITCWQFAHGKHGRQLVSEVLQLNGDPSRHLEFQIPGPPVVCDIKDDTLKVQKVSFKKGHSDVVVGTYAGPAVERAVLAQSTDVILVYSG